MYFIREIKYPRKHFKKRRIRSKEIRRRDKDDKDRDFRKEASNRCSTKTNNVGARVSRQGDRVKELVDFGKGEREVVVGRIRKSRKHEKVERIKRRRCRPRGFGG